MHPTIESIVKYLLLESGIELASLMFHDSGEALTYIQLEQGIHKSIQMKGGTCDILLPLSTILDSISPSDLSDESVKTEITSVIGANMYNKIILINAVIEKHANQGIPFDMLYFITNDIDLDKFVNDVDDTLKDDINDEDVTLLSKVKYDVNTMSQIHTDALEKPLFDKLVNDIIRQCRDNYDEN